MVCKRIEENIYFLPGTSSSNIFYLKYGLEGLIDTGHPQEIEQNLAILGAAGFEPKELDFIINTHSHADHVGANSYLKRLNRDIQIIGSKRMAEYQASRKDNAIFREMEDDFSEYALDYEVQDNDIIDIGGCRLEILDGPGHSRDSIAVYIQTKGILLCGDTVYNKAVTQVDYYQDLDVSLKELLETYHKLKRKHAAIIYSGHGHPVRNIKDTFEFCLNKLPRFMRNHQLALINNAIPLVETYIANNPGCAADQMKGILCVSMKAYANRFAADIAPSKIEKIVHEIYALMNMLKIFKVENERLYLAHRLNGYIAAKNCVGI